LKRFSEVFRDSRSSVLAAMARALLALEDVVEELEEVRGIEVDSASLDVEYLERTGAPIRILVAAPGREGVLDEGEGYVIEATPYAEDNVWRLYEELATFFASYAYRRLGRYLPSPEGTEYFLAVMDSGEVFLAQGFRDRVSLPIVDGMVLTAHTHPNNVYWFSRPDLRTALEFFSRRGFATAVVTQVRTALLYRVGPFTLEDYEALLKASRTRDAEEAYRLLEEAPNLRVVLV